MINVIKKETLIDSFNSCKIESAKLGDSIGDIAAIAIAYERDSNEIY